MEMVLGSMNQPSMKRNIETKASLGSRNDTTYFAPRHSALGQVAFKPSQLCSLRAVQINIMHCPLLDPWDNPRNIVKVHITTSAQCMKRLLQPGGATFSVGWDNYIGCLRVV
ncbi:MAG: hypothetical protein ACJASL_004780 [Paraglaciecola sp.]|jgi:hypothetical protein